MPDVSSVLFAVGYLLIFVGFVAALTPVLPGPLLIWLGALVWAWADGFVRVGWSTLLLLALLAILSWAADVGLSLVSSRRSGAGWRSIATAMLSGLLGAALLSFIPVVGTIVGAAAGSLAGLWVMEYLRARDAAVPGPAAESGAPAPAHVRRAAATQAVKGYVAGFFASMAVKLFISVIMVGIFFWQAFL